MNGWLVLLRIVSAISFGGFCFILGMMATLWVFKERSQENPPKFYAGDYVEELYVTKEDLCKK